MKNFTIIAFFTSLVLLGVSLTAVTYSQTVHDQTMEQLTFKKTAAETLTEELTADSKTRDKTVINLTTELTLVTTLLGQREEVIAAITNYVTAKTNATDKVDITTHHEAVLAHQATILAATTVEEIVSARDSIVAITAEVTQKTTEYDAEQARIAEQGRNSYQNNSGGNTYTNNGGGGGNWFSEMRQILNDVGGSWVSLEEFDGYCGGTWAKGCATPGLIRINSSAADESTWRKYWIMTHELAHIHQFGRWDELNNDSQYHDLFGGNPEKMANCMATLRGYSVTSCTQDQLNYAGGYW